MAFTSPKNWVADEIVVASGSGSLNEQIRDNLLVLSTHTHTGAAGMGSATLSNVTLTGLNTSTFSDQSSNPSTNGRLQRNGAALLYYNGSTAVNLTASDQAAATASMRTLGTGATQAAAGNHSHTLTFAEVQIVTDTGSYSSWSTGASNEEEITTVNITPGAATNRAVIITFAGISKDGQNNPGLSGGWTIKLKYGSTTVKTVTGSSGYSGSGAAPPVMASYTPNSTSTQAVSATANPAGQTWGGGAVVIMYGSMGAIEVSGTP